jgi:AraC-like DNA-binding protein
MLSHALKREKRLINYLIAIFSASLCMVGAQELSAERLGAYQYLIGLATCATCNVVWLISRTLFREHKPISRRHIALALIIAGLIMFNQSWHLITATDAQNILSATQMLRLKEGMNEITTLLSSCILVLSFWEALRNYTRKNTVHQRYSIVFAAAFFFGVFVSSVLPKFLFSPTETTLYFPWLMVTSAIGILGAIQYITYSQERYQRKHATPALIIPKPEIQQKNQCQDTEVDAQLVEGLEKLINEKIYLRPNLKIAHFAQALDTSEYLISKIIRNHSKVANFNLFINQYRVEYAKKLLLSDDSQDWSILVIAMESGFSSLGTFNRVFKTITGQMPSEFRKQSNIVEALTSL